jgi:hypothetical protein
MWPTTIATPRCQPTRRTHVLNKIGDSLEPHISCVVGLMSRPYEAFRRHVRSLSAGAETETEVREAGTVRAQILVTSEPRHRLKHPPTRCRRCCDTRYALREVVLLHGHDRSNELDRQHSPGCRAALLIRCPPASMGAPLHGRQVPGFGSASPHLGHLPAGTRRILPSVSLMPRSKVSHPRMDGRGPRETTGTKYNRLATCRPPKPRPIRADRTPGR